VECPATVDLSNGIGDSSLLGGDVASLRSLWWLVIGYGGGTVANSRWCFGLCTAYLYIYIYIESSATPL
jgi:hypothetical protein